MSELPESSLFGQEPPTPSSKAPGLVDQILGVFTEPSNLFSRLRSAPSWWPALLLIMGIGIAAGLIWAYKVDMAEMARHQMESMRDLFHVNIPEDAIDQAIAKNQGQHPWISTILGQLFGIPIVYLIISLVVWAFASMGTMEGEDSPTFPQAFSVTVVHYLVTLPSILLAGIVAAAVQVGGRNIQQLMPTCASFYFHPESIWLKCLLSVIDPLWVLSFVVLAIGMKQTLRSKPWAIATTLLAFGIFGLAFRALGGLFS
jgi:hypothetical protein